MLSRLLPPLALSLLVSGCASPEAQLRTGLVNAGLSTSMAGCMAKPMARELSIDQLLKLRSLSKVRDMDMRTTRYDQFLRQVRALRDPEIVSVTTSAAVGCALGI